MPSKSLHTRIKPFWMISVACSLFFLHLYPLRCCQSPDRLTLINSWTTRWWIYSLMISLLLYIHWSNGICQAHYYDEVGRWLSGCCRSSVILIAFICHYKSLLMDDKCLQASFLLLNLIELKPMFASLPNANCNLSAVFFWGLHKKMLRQCYLPVDLSSLLVSNLSIQWLVKVKWLRNVNIKYANIGMEKG